MKNPLRILFAGGGTGGHLYSGIAVAEEILHQFSNAEIIFVGTPFGLEKKIVPEAGFHLELMNVSPLKGSGMKARLASFLKLPRAYQQAQKILKKFKPDFVMGIGGYASGPMTLAARFAGIPTAIIEQNAYPGFTNRQLGRFVDRVFLAFPEAKSFFKSDKVRVTGNPIRRKFLEKVDAIQPSERAEAEKKLKVFILGGSQGAHALNQAIVEALPQLQDQVQSFHFMHQTGAQDEAWVKENYQKLGLNAEVFAFSSEILSYYQQADLVLCRSGAGTITELTLLGIPAILVPYPFAADNHQWHNAQEMVRVGAALLVNNSELKGDRVASLLKGFLQNPSELQKMSEASQSLGKPHAAQNIVEDTWHRILLDKVA